MEARSLPPRATSTLGVVDRPERGVQLRLIQPGEPNQNAYIESSDGRLRDECLNEHWIPTLLRARAEIETWRQEYNEERPENILGGLSGGLTPAPMPNSWRPKPLR